MTIYLIDGKPHRLCDCDEHTELCPRGVKRALQTCGFSRCFVPAPDAIYATDPALPGLELAAEICREIGKDWYGFDERKFHASVYLAQAIEAEIAKLTLK